MNTRNAIGLRNVLPRPARQYPVDRASSYLEFVSDGLDREPSARAQLSDFNNIRLINHGFFVAFSSRHSLNMQSRSIPVPARHAFRVHPSRVLVAPCQSFGMETRAVSVPARGSVFRNHIRRIVSICPQEQMRRVAAGSIIAFVQNTQTLRVCTETQRIGKLMRFNGFFHLGKMAVAVGCSPFPFPAFIRPLSIDAAPKSFLVFLGEACNRLVSVSHIVIVLGVRAVSVLNTLRRFAFFTAKAWASQPVFMGRIARLN